MPRLNHCIGNRESLITTGSHSFSEDGRSGINLIKSKYLRKRAPANSATPKMRKTIPVRYVWTVLYHISVKMASVKG
jgi:hypothetical protein